jgi:hypothetical protein
MKFFFVLLYVPKPACLPRDWFGRKGYDSEVKKLRYEQDRFDSTGLSNCRWVLVLSCGTSGTCKRLDALDFQALPKL